MTRSKDSATDASRVGADERTDAGDWDRRHARLAFRTSGRLVRADPPADDWQARHAWTKRD